MLTYVVFLQSATPQLQSNSRSEMQCKVVCDACASPGIKGLYALKFV